MHSVRAINQRARLLREVVRGSRCQRSKSSIKPSRLAINGKDRTFEMVEPSRETNRQYRQSKQELSIRSPASLDVLLIGVGHVAAGAKSAAARRKERSI
jgi:hypothetical protein